MTERLYYRDSYLREFDAQVLSCVPAVAGSPAKAAHAVVLDRTAFYPTSGGQPFDTGKLGDAAVLDVQDSEDSIVHFTDRPLAAGSARGVIDWDRRFDHMQQHTGQHLLSAAFVALFKFPTVGFHLGRQVSTIDLDARSLVPRHLEEAERLTNRVIFEDRALQVSEMTRDALAGAGVRKEVNREGPLRVVEVPGFDRQPCGGTHVARTGEVGLVLLRKYERVKQNWRVEFVCGFRALAAARSDFAVLGEAARMISCGLPEVPAMVKRILDETQAGQRGRQKLLEQLAEYESRALLAAETVTSAGRVNVQRAGNVVVRVFDDADAAYLRLLATKLAAEPGVVALLATRAGGNVVFAQSPGGSRDMSALLRETVAAAGGKGGGTKDFAQGSIPDAARLDEMLARAASALG